jgi:esterase/lipase
MGAALASLVAASTKYKIHRLVLVSPYFGVKDQKADLLAGYFGDYIAELYFQGYRSFKPVNDMQEQYWTTRYPAKVLKQVMRISMSVRQTNFENIKAPVFVAYSKDDEVIDFTKVEKKYEQIQTHKRMDADPTYLSHVLAGDIVNPRGNAKLQKNLYSFIKANY